MKPVKFKHYRYVVGPGLTILMQDDFTSLRSLKRLTRAYTSVHAWASNNGKTPRIISQGGITLAYDQYEEGDEQVRVAFSVCSIEDNFDKTTGREQSEWRLNGVVRHHLSATIPVKELEAMLAVKNDANQLKAVMRLIDWHTSLE